MKLFFNLISLSFALSISAQNTLIKGQLLEEDGSALPFANTLLFQSSDSSLAKANLSTETGQFSFNDMPEGSYNILVRYLGMEDYTIENIQVKSNAPIDLGTIKLKSSGIQLHEATVKADRTLIEVKPDRLVFNVEGTINSAGSDALTLLRKAPSVTVDNNDNITVLGRSGALIYVDGKRLPINGADLTNYLQNLPADQIDKIDIITNPGSRYEAEGNAGIIDIRLKRNKNFGTNGSVNSSLSQGKYGRYNISTTANYRNTKFNIFGNAGLGQQKGFNTLDFISFQNGLYIEELNETLYNGRFTNIRLGGDYFINPHHTIGVLVTNGYHKGDPLGFNRIKLANDIIPYVFDSILIAHTETHNIRRQNTYNLNYRYVAQKGKSLNVDLDFGRFNNASDRNQPNQYFNADQTQVLSESTNQFSTPTDIDIYTLKLDYDQDLWTGKISIGSKLSRVISDNTYLVYDEINHTPVRNDKRSNRFKYEENVYAGYINFNRNLNSKWQVSGGLRLEQTDATGDLKAFLPELQEPPVQLNYLSWFPSAGISWQLSPKHNFALNYGRRINRPDYNVLNPFNNQLSQLSFERGNPFLNPEIVNNIELGYTLASRYNLKFGYSLTNDQITRLIGPDTSDLRASYINWENLATQKIWSGNLSAPIDINSFWNAYINLSTTYTDNQADYGDGATVDVQAFNYSIYEQNTFNLPKGIKVELSGYYSGPGVWGGVFVFEPSWSIDLGIQKKFLKDRLNVKLSGSDLFYQSGWDGKSDFNGLRAEGFGRYDSRRISLSLGYQFGNQNVKSRKRETGLEVEAGRVQ